ncbi:OmpA family protein [Paracoccus aminovorans]|uniref:OmpA family protein n=1 Tax=Paracoccus aminovorans TaxID=34004 RepID=A0A1I2YXT5_9RHOB|nr:OmpA family protein [Paracoccus aminovorans]CQR85845.1 OmpA/MotB domain-containing protein [Paracoccus aminovorans]SFH30433.1 OmpA family protein [Paracoccus aminovorans]
MRRIYKTTTAMVACLSMIAPQLAVAQAQQEQTGDQQVILPNQKKPEETRAEKAKKRKAEQQQEQQAEQPEPQRRQAEKPQARQEAPAEAEAGQQRKPRRQAEPQGEAQQQPEQREAAPQRQPEKLRERMQKSQGDAEADAPRRKPPVTQADEPREKPPVVEAETPRTKPADAENAARRAEQMQEEARKQPAPKPDSAKAVTTSDPAPGERPQQERPRREKPAAQAPQPAAEKGDTPDADQLKKALEARNGGEAHPKPGQMQPGEADSALPRKEQEKGARDAAGADRRQEDQQQRKQNQRGQQQADEQQPGQRAPGKPPQPAPRAAGDQPEAPDAAELGRRLQQEQQQDRQAQDNQKGRPGEAQPGEIEAPEARVRPNDVARRAAESLPPAAATALAAAGQQQEQGELDEVRITRDNARRSDQDFETSIIKGLQGEPQRETKRDKDDDTLKDIGKMLLAGAAGMAVGKMLSNDRQVALNTGDRVVVTLPDGSQQVIRDDNALLYQPGSDVRTERFDDGSTRTTVLREDGSRVVTIRDADMNILRRTLVRADGSETRLIDDTAAEPVRISTLPAPPPVEISRRPLDETALREALRREAAVDRRFSLGQIRDIPEVRALVAPVNVPEITFDTGSAAITPDQAQQLATLGKVIRDSIDQDPREVYMIEGYTDAVGSDAANLALSDRRAESVALALTEYFQVPPENMVVQGYGEQFLLVPSDGPERDNRRVAVRRITDLLELAQN